MRSHLSLCFSCVPAWWSCWMMIFRSDPCAMKQFTCHSAPLVESLLWALETSFLQLDPKPSPMLSWTNLLLVFRRPALFFFLHRGSVRAHICLFVCARQHHQTPNSEADDQVDFACSVGVIFRIMFCYFSLFLRIMRFCENWAPMHARARFWGSGPLWMLCFTTSSPFWKLERSRRLMSRGRGTLSKILSGQVGPPLVARMLIVRTATGDDPKWTTPHRCLGSRLRVVAKELCLILIKSSK